MKFRFSRMCRGQGVAYIECIVTVQNKKDHVVFSAESEKGTPLPIEAYRREGFSAGQRLYILTTPLLCTKEIRIRAAEIDCLSGEECSYAVKTLSRFALKWLSRLNYKLDFQKTSLIRDTDHYAYSNQIHVKLQTFIDVGIKNQYVAKGVICYPITESEPVVNVVRGDGSRISDPTLILGKTSVTSSMGLKRGETSFSFRFPKDGETYCLVASGSSSVRSGFLCFDRGACMAYAASSPLFYKASAPNEYHARSAARERLLAFADPADYENVAGPTFSIIVPLYKTPIPFLRDMVASVQTQLYQSWELILVNASPEDAELAAAVESLDDDRIRVITLDENKGIADNTNVGIEAATGEYVVFFDHDDTLDPFALYKYTKAINEDVDIDALYCDEDFLNEDGEYVAPHFKSDFNIDLLRCHNYITHLLAVRSSYAKELMLRPAFDGAQDYDFLLRLVERTQRIAHIQDVLYHWRISDTSTAKSAGNKGYADEAGRRALQEHLDRCGLDATAESTDVACFYQVAYHMVNEPLVSIVIPNKDNTDVLKRCIDSVQEKSTYRNFEIIVVENNSEESVTFEYYERLQKEYPNVKVITWEGPFNYSAINNFALPFVSGQYLLFLNNDIEVIEPRWMEAMLGLCQREDVGAVGAKLLFPDDTVQHAGVMMIKCQSVNDIAGPIHVFSSLDRDDSGYMRRASLVQDLSAVTAACMMTKRSVFERLNGFDEDFEVAFNDVDYCLRVREMGKLVVYTPDALLYHYESVSRGSDTLPQHAERFMREQGKLRIRWSSYYAKGDPYHGPASTVAYLSEMP